MGIQIPPVNFSSTKSNLTKCIICGHEDNLTFCSDCGHQLKDDKDEIRPMIYYIDVLKDVFLPFLEGITTFLLFLFQPLNVYKAIFYGAQIDSDVKVISQLRIPIITSVWKRIVNKKQSILDPGQYLAFATILYFLTLGFDVTAAINPTILKDQLLSRLFQTVSSESFNSVILLVVFASFFIFAQIINKFFPKISTHHAYQLSLYFNSTTLILILFFGVASYYLIPLMSKLAGGIAYDDFIRQTGGDKYLVILLPTNIQNPREYPIFFWYYFVPIIFLIHTIIAPTIYIPRILKIGRIRFFISLIGSYFATLLTSIVLTVLTYFLFSGISDGVIKNNWSGFWGLTCVLLPIILIGATLVFMASKLIIRVAKKFKSK